MKTSSPALMTEYRRRGWWSEARIPDLFDAALRENPGGLAVVDAPNRKQLCGGEVLRLDFTSLQRLIEGYQLRLDELGLVRDDILVTQLPNIAEYVAVYIAAMRLGIIVSPVPMQFRRNELEKIIALTNARALLTVSEFKGTSPAADALAAAQGQGTRVLIMSGAAPAGALPFTPAEPSLAALAALQARTSALGLGADDIATVCWTSGTEGIPKGVPRSHNHWLAISWGHLDGAGIRPREALLNPFPLVNMAALGGCFMSWLRSAGTLLLHHPLDLGVYLKQIAQDRPQYAIAPPAVLNMLLQDEKLLAMTDLSSLRCIGSGSAPLDPAMIRGFRDRFGIEIVNNFGSNEGMSIVSGANEAPDPELRATLFPRFGRPDIQWPQRIASMIETRIVDTETGSEILGAGRPGEMQIRGPMVFDGYFRAPKLTAAAFTQDGYFRTGDLFEIAGEGDLNRYYRFVGRLKQLIVRGGVKIAPEEIEAVLVRHALIAEASAIGYRDAVMGERICAVVVPAQQGVEVSLREVQDLFRDAGMAVFKCPERIRFVEKLPRNAVGKVVRSELVALAESPD